MLNLSSDQLLDDTTARIEQSRFSYNSQTEEFRQLNESFQTYLHDIKRIDNENRQLQDNIDQMHRTYIKILEDHIKRLAKDFHHESNLLSESHVERYKLKSRGRRYISEREELKKRIQFLTVKEKENGKRLAYLQKQDRAVYNEYKFLKDQIQTLTQFVENEKQTHQQAMDKVDHLQALLEQLCIERSKVEFDIQTLREEIQLMQTTKDFLNEERQTILTTRSEANEYLLSCLNDSIKRIREDFNNLNQTQIKQIENEYKQTLKFIEENALVNAANLIPQKQLEVECETVSKELTDLNDENQALSEQILDMENDLCTLRNQYKRELISKDNEVERNKIEVQSLNDQLNHLAEYDRNLKFELTLYRGVLEGECRRKKQINDQQSSMQLPILSDSEFVSMLANYANGKKNQIEVINSEQSTDDRIETKILLVTTEEPLTNSLMDASASQSITDPSNSSIDEGLSFNNDQQTSISAETSRNPERPLSRIEEIAQDTDGPSSTTEDVPVEPERPASVADDSSSERERRASEDANTSQEIDGFPSTIDESSVEYETASLAAAETSQENQRPPSTIRETELETCGPLATAEETAPEEIPAEIETSASISEVIPQKINRVPSTSEEVVLVVEDHGAEHEELSVEDASLETERPSTAASDIPSEIEQAPPENEEVLEKLTSAKRESFSTDEDPTRELNNSNLSDNQVQIQKDESILQNEEMLAEVENILSDKDKPESRREESPDGYEESFTALLQNATQTIDVLMPFATRSDHPIDTVHTEDKELGDSQLSKKSDEEEFSDSKIDSIEEKNRVSSNDDTAVTQEEVNKSSFAEPSSNIIETNDDKQTEVVDSSNSQIAGGEEVPEKNNSNLPDIMRDLRYIFRELSNENGFIEINDGLPSNLIDRLEFGDVYIRTLFEKLITGYVVEPAKSEVGRFKTFDWTDFRDMLFPILTGRFMERHIRFLFNIFDVPNDGYLPLKQITELLELLQFNHPLVFVQSMSKDPDAGLDGKLTVNELIDGIKVGDRSNNLLSESVQYEQWYAEHPLDEFCLDNQSDSVDLPTEDLTPSPMNKSLNDTIGNQLRLLGRIFKRTGVDIDSRKLDCSRPTLSMQITNEFVNNNINVSNNDLQTFIESYLNQKRKSYSLIDWIEFRDVFFPFINGGKGTKEDIKRWFDILDNDQLGVINEKQLFHFLRILQIPTPEIILNKIIAISDEYKTETDRTLTFKELMFAFEMIEETANHILSNNEQILSYDIYWFNDTIF